MTEGGFLVFMGILLLLVVIVVVIAVVSSVAGAAAAIVDDEDGEDEQNRVRTEQWGGTFVPVPFLQVLWILRNVPRSNHKKGDRDYNAVTYIFVKWSEVWYSCQ